MKTPSSQKKSRKNENMRRKMPSTKYSIAINKEENKATLASLYLHKLIFN